MEIGRRVVGLAAVIAPCMAPRGDDASGSDRRRRRSGGPVRRRRSGAESDFTSRASARAFRQWAGRWQAEVPAAVACLEQNLEPLLAFFTCPAPHWRTIRTTNAVERVFREVRRRTRPMSCFTNAASCDQIIYAVIHHLNTQWERYPQRQFAQKS